MEFPVSEPLRTLLKSVHGILPKRFSNDFPFPTHDDRRKSNGPPRCPPGFGPRGACEPWLYRFTGQAPDDSDPLAKRVAAFDLHEAIAYMRKWHLGLRVLWVALVALRTGSPSLLPVSKFKSFPIYFPGIAGQSDGQTVWGYSAVNRRVVGSSPTRGAKLPCPTRTHR